MKKVIVTGGAGFIGSHTVVELHDAGFKPIIIDNFSNSEESAIQGIEAIINEPVSCYRIDCNDPAALDEVFKKEGTIHGVIHFAAFKAVGESVKEPLKYYENNVGSMVTLLQVMKDHNVKDIVFSSSCTVYGQPESSPVAENAPDKNASSPYGATKVICEQVIQDHIDSDPDSRAVILRYFNPIGAHPSASIGELPIGVPDNLVPFIAQTAAGLREKLTVFGGDLNTPDGSCVRDYIHVVDLAKAHVRALQYMSDQDAPYVETFNLGVGKGVSVLEVVEAFERVSGMKLNYEIGPRRAGDVEQIWADPKKANDKLGWKCELGIDTALKDAWRWQQKLVGALNDAP